jgi:hypothetical protein
MSTRPADAGRSPQAPSTSGPVAAQDPVHRRPGEHLPAALRRRHHRDHRPLHPLARGPARASRSRGADPFPIRWHRLEPAPGRFDWSDTDAALEHLRELGIAPIIDLVHHTSYPIWLSDGFRDRRFHAAFLRYTRSGRHPLSLVGGVHALQRAVHHLELHRTRGPVAALRPRGRRSGADDDERPAGPQRVGRTGTRAAAGGQARLGRHL